MHRPRHARTRPGSTTAWVILSTVSATQFQTGEAIREQHGQNNLDQNIRPPMRWFLPLKPMNVAAWSSWCRA